MIKEVSAKIATSHDSYSVPESDNLKGMHDLEFIRVNQLAFYEKMVKVFIFIEVKINELIKFNEVIKE